MKKASELFDNLKLTNQQKNIINIAGKIGREKLATRATKIDREAINPMNNYDDLRECGIHRMCVPERFGGLGHNFATYIHLCFFFLQFPVYRHSKWVFFFGTPLTIVGT